MLTCSYREAVTIYFSDYPLDCTVRLISSFLKEIHIVWDMRLPVDDFLNTQVGCKKEPGALGRREGFECPVSILSVDDSRIKQRHFGCDANSFVVA
ncbi:hypothetical protein GCM10009680_15630 [Streptomyces yatensis]|uniref:Transposase IS701-like DDE domain-containing protein n=1 Tax=Streptomyces yatensis TaxID=155177 RepID=A0ABN2GUC2_9ACTN